jgi:uncharacterized membrane protein
MSVIHPAFIHFPIALILVSFLCDLCGYISRSSSLRSAAWWTLFAAGGFGIVAALTGFWDMQHVPMDDTDSTYVDFHMWVGIASLFAAVVLIVWRGMFFKRREVITCAYLTASSLVVALVLFQGWIGGELVYSYGVGVAPAGQSKEKVVKAQSRLKEVESVLGPFNVSHEHIREDKTR